MVCNNELMYQCESIILTPMRWKLNKSVISFDRNQCRNEQPYHAQSKFTLQNPLFVTPIIDIDRRLDRIETDTSDWKHCRREITDRLITQKIIATE